MNRRAFFGSAAATVAAYGVLASPRQTFTALDQDGLEWTIEILRPGIGDHPPVLATTGGQHIEWLGKGKYQLGDSDGDPIRLWSEAENAP